MLIFGVLFPALVAWVVSGWLAKRLRSWWGAILSVIGGFIVGVTLPAAAYGIIADYIFNGFDGEWWLRAVGMSIWAALFAGIWSITRVRRGKE